MQILKISLILLLISLTAACQSDGMKKVNKSDLETDSAKVSYALGVDLGKNIKLQGVEVDIDIFMAGLRVSLEEGEALMTEEEVTNAILSYHTKKREEQDVKLKEQAAPNIEAGEKFLAENKTKPGVKTTESGLQYKVLKKGSGKRPTAESLVTIHYTGTFIDGKVFDSSVNKGTPLTHPVNQFIRGWTEGLQLMQVGSKYMFYIPYELAYGLKGSGPIPPASVLVFEVELLDVKS
ncbi:MAG: peptidyl-prolyl cis-trans isomerase [Melioribacteraceae bacterium]|nr:MAG: peptidyl-prolyl cis-trans isomerase [Melioribacteraceae bacterium]